MRERLARTRVRKAVEIHPRIVVDPRIHGGRPIVRGTRVPIHVLVGGVASGAATDELCRAYGVTPADVRAALEYAAASVEEERLVALPR